MYRQSVPCWVERGQTIVQRLASGRLLVTLASDGSQAWGAFGGTPFHTRLDGARATRIEVRVEESLDGENWSALEKSREHDSATPDAAPSPEPGRDPRTYRLHLTCQRESAADRSTDRARLRRSPAPPFPRQVEP